MLANLATQIATIIVELNYWHFHHKPKSNEYQLYERNSRKCRTLTFVSLTSLEQNAAEHFRISSTLWHTGVKEGREDCSREYSLYTQSAVSLRDTAAIQ